MRQTKKDRTSGLCFKSVILLLVFIYVYLLFAAGDDLLDSSSTAYQLWYVMMATTVVRFKYYHAWLWADAICNNSGIGFNGFDERGRSRWDLISNINVINFEVIVTRQ